MNVGVHQTHCCVVHGCKYGDEDCPVVTVDKKSGMTSPAVCSLEAVYVACQYVLDVKCQRDYKDIVAAKKHKKETKATNVVKFANKTH